MPSKPPRTLASARREPSFTIQPRSIRPRAPPAAVEFPPPTDTRMNTVFKSDTLASHNLTGSLTHTVPTFFYADTSVADYDADHNNAGHYRCTLSVAWRFGAGGPECCFYEERDWQASFGYSAYGVDTRLLSVTEGVERLMRAGMLDAIVGASMPDAVIEEQAARDARASLTSRDDPPEDDSPARIVVEPGPGPRVELISRPRG